MLLRVVLAEALCSLAVADGHKAATTITSSTSTTTIVRDSGESEVQGSGDGDVIGGLFISTTPTPTTATTTRAIPFELFISSEMFTWEDAKSFCVGQNGFVAWAKTGRAKFALFDTEHTLHSHVSCIWTCNIETKKRI